MGPWAHRTSGGVGAAGRAEAEAADPEFPTRQVDFTVPLVDRYLRCAGITRSGAGASSARVSEDTHPTIPVYTGLDMVSSVTYDGATTADRRAPEVLRSSEQPSLSSQR